MERLRLLYFIQAAGILAVAQALCGKECLCEITESGDMLVTCKGKNLTRVPVDLPQNTTKL